jgi:hypothetical protein
MKRIAMQCAVLTAFLASSGAAMSMRRAVVHIDSVGGKYFDESTRILFYGTGRVSLGIGIDAPVQLRDTIRLDHMPAFTADVTDGDVHIKVEGKGSISVAGEVTGGTAGRLAAGGRHIILLRGGGGIQAK